MLKRTPITVYNSVSQTFLVVTHITTRRKNTDRRKIKKKKLMSMAVAHMAVISRGSLNDLVNKYFFVWQGNPQSQNILLTV